MKLAVLLLMLLLFSAAGVPGDQPAARTPLEGTNADVRDSVHLLSEDVDTMFVIKKGESFSDRNSRWKAARVEFDSRLDTIARVLTNNPKMAERIFMLIESSPSLAATFVRIAVDRHQHKKKYDEFPDVYRRTYVFPGVKRGSRPPLPLEEHCTEQLRLVWEYYLLVPNKNELPGTIWPTGLLALGKIGNSKSIVVIHHVARAIVHPRSIYANTRAKYEALYALSNFKSAVGFKSMVEYVLHAEQTSAQSQEGLKKMFSEIINSCPSGDEAQPWLVLVEDYLQGTCPEAHRQILQEVRQR